MTKVDRLRRYLTEDKIWTWYVDLQAVPQGWAFIGHPDGGIAAWRKPPHWALTQAPGDPIRLRTRLGFYRP